MIHADVCINQIKRVCFLRLLLFTYCVNVTNTQTEVTSDPRTSGNQLLIRTKPEAAEKTVTRGILLSEAFNKTPGKIQIWEFFKVCASGEEFTHGGARRVATGGRSLDHLLGLETQGCVSVSLNKCPISEAFIFP